MLIFLQMFNILFQKLTKYESQLKIKGFTKTEKLWLRTRMRILIQLKQCIKNYWIMIIYFKGLVFNKSFPSYLMPNFVTQQKGRHGFGWHESQKGWHGYSKQVSSFVGCPSAQGYRQHILDLNQQVGLLQFPTKVNIDNYGSCSLKHHSCIGAN